MNIDLKVRFSTTEHAWLCFQHAIVVASHGGDVDIDVDDYSSEYYLGPMYCVMCRPEYKLSTTRPKEAQS